MYIAIWTLFFLQVIKFLLTFSLPQSSNSWRDDISNSDFEVDQPNYPLTNAVDVEGPKTNSWKKPYPFLGYLLYNKLFAKFAARQRPALLCTTSRTIVWEEVWREVKP